MLPYIFVGQIYNFIFKKYQVRKLKFVFLKIYIIINSQIKKKHYLCSLN